MDVLHWPTLLKKDGDDLFDHYRHMLEPFLWMVWPSNPVITKLLACYHTDIEIYNTVR